MKRNLKPEDWGLKVNGKSELLINSYVVKDLATKFGTPLHILNENRLIQTARDFRSSIKAEYSGKVSVHYAFKCNSVPGVVDLINQGGLQAEVMTEYELELAYRLGYKPEQIIVNGPCKTESFLLQCLKRGVRFIVIDSLKELDILNHLVISLSMDVDILLRVNPDFIPTGINKNTATGSRKNCVFGLDIKDGEIDEALRRLKNYKNLNFHGFHFHIGTGIRKPEAYFGVLTKLYPVFRAALQEGYKINVVDVGGGYASSTTREMTSSEMLKYQILGRIPDGSCRSNGISINDFGKEISKGITGFFDSKNLPELILEPGRCIASPNQFLLLSINYVKKRSGIAKWLITDGGLGTVTLPTYYEFHEVFLCNDISRQKTELATITGPCCFAGDIVYRGKKMPFAQPGEVIAIMDSGAYFTALESSFGFPRPAIIGVNGNSYRLIRERETFDDMVARDRFFQLNKNG